MKKTILLFTIILAFVSCSKEDTTQENDENNEGDTTIYLNQKATGSSSNDLLSATTFKSIVIELVYVEGYKPNAKSITNFLSFLEARTFKPDGITVEARAIASPGNSPYSIEEIKAFEDANRTKYNTDNEIVIWAFFADGTATTNSNSGSVLGTAYRNTSFVIYEETIHDLSNSAFEPNRTLLETTVITHELGHLLGLTNLGTDMVVNHEDTEHSKHCNVESCLMYWSAESGSGISNLMGTSTAPTLDNQCIADLKANGGK